MNDNTEQDQQQCEAAADASGAVAQNPMQPAIQGYRKFDQPTSDYINSVKDLGHQVEAKLEEAAALGASPRELALARTHFQQGAMWLIRSVAKPEGLF